MKKIELTQEQMYNFANFIEEYLDENISCELLTDRHNINCKNLNFTQAVDAWINQNIE